MPLAHQVRPQLRKLAFPKMGEALEQLLASYQLQNRVSQKFQLLVVTDPVLALARLLRFLFPRLRTVRDRLFNDGPPPEMIAQPLFQRRNFPFLHTESCIPPSNLTSVAENDRTLRPLGFRGRRGWSRRRAHAQFGEAILLIACCFAGARVWPVLGQLYRLIGVLQGLWNLVLHVERDRQSQHRNGIHLLGEGVDRLPYTAFRLRPILSVGGQLTENRV